eukprot:scaffold1052_cov237-Pinguiococcus_pyrenoidosus.AAC.2
MRGRADPHKCSVSRQALPARRCPFRCFCTCCQRLLPLPARADPLKHRWNGPARWNWRRVAKASEGGPQSFVACLAPEQLRKLVRKTAAYTAGLRTLTSHSLTTQKAR